MRLHFTGNIRPFGLVRHGAELHEDKWNPLVNIVVAFEAEEAIHNDDNDDNQ